MTEVEETLDKAVCLLAVNSPASFHLLSRMQKHADSTIETMCVCVKSGHIYLLYNPSFFMSLTVSERTYVLIHEMLHVLLHHCTHRCSNDRARAHKENVAMDLAINSLINEEQGISIPRFKENVNGRKVGEVMSLLPKQFKFPPLLSFEEYLALLDEKYPDRQIKFVRRALNGACSNSSGKGSSGMTGKDSSGMTGNGNSEDEGDGVIEIWDVDQNCPIGEITHGRISVDHDKGFDEDPFIDDYIRNMVENISRNNLWGSMTAGAVECVKKAQEQPLNWADILRLKIGPFVSFEKQPSRRRWNKHYGKPFLGVTTKSVEPVAVYADTSGSVPTEDLSRFIVEVERIAHYTTVYLWSFDTQVHSPDEPEEFSRRNIEMIDFKGRGGTSFTPIFEHAKSKNISQVIILTDGCAEKVDPSLAEGMDVVWVITSGGNKTGKPGEVVEMKPGGGR